MPDPTDPPKSSVVSLDAARPDLTGGDGTPTVIGKTLRSPVVEALNLTAGSMLGHFEVIAPLGAGGMASVLKARDTQLGRTVALKILPPDAAKDPDAVSRFKHEARAVAKLDHENVARVFFSGEDRGLHYIAFEFVEGETLRARIERLGRLPSGEAVRFLLHCAAGLQHLSDRGVVHRDIKPGNVVITPDGRAKLIDLGLARNAEALSVNGGVTQSGVTLGTFDYISPEQARDPRTADVRADIYSLGCTFYHALTGRPPVPEGNAAVKLTAQQHAAPTDPRELNPDLPDALAVVLGRMMMKKPEARYQTPAELSADLTGLARSLGVLEGTGEAAALSSSQLPRLTAAPPRFPIGWVVAGVVLLAVGLVFASLTGGSPHGSVAQPWTDPPPVRPVNPFEGLGKDDPQRNPPLPSVRLATNADELLAATKADVAHVTLQPGKVYDLAETAGLTFNGQKLTVECLDPRTPAVIRVAVSPLPAEPQAARAGGFTVTKADTVTLRNIRFKFVEKAEGDGDVEEPVGVALLDVAKVELRDCAWDDPDAKAVQSQTAGGLQVGNGTRTKPTEFTARHCYFGARRMTGVEFAGPVAGGFAECGFATAARAIRLTSDADGPTDPASALELKHCTFLLDLRAVAVQAESVKVGITAGFCVFAAPAPPDPSGMMMTDGDRKPAALRATGDTSGVTYAAAAGEPSAYFRTDIPPGAAGADSVDVTTAPWKTVPASPDKTEPWKALELNPSVRAIRVSRPAGVHILGATWLPNAGARLYADWPPGSANAPKPGVKVWYPNPPASEKGQLPTGVFEDLQKAIDSLRANDVLHVHANGPVKVPAVTLSKALRARIQPGDGYAPVLVPAAAGPMFRVEDGELRFERLHFRLTFPEEAAGTAATLVSVAGGKGVTWTECTLTADESVTDSSAMVQVNPGITTGTRPEVRFEKCLVRGTGRVVRVPAAIPTTVSFTNSVVAVGGPVVQLGAPDGKPTEGAVFRMHLAQTTAALAAPLVDVALLEMADAPFVPVQIDAETALLTPVEKAAGPILRAAGGDTAAKLFQWQTPPGSANRFANFPPNGAFAELPKKRLDSADWLAFTKEKKSALVKLAFSQPPAGVAGLPAVTAADLAVTDADPPDEYGAKAGAVPVPPVPLDPGGPAEK